MEFFIYTIYDTVADNYRQPMFIENVESAKRMFAYILKTTDFMNENAEQFELKYLGSFNMKNGEMKSEKKPIHVCKGTDLIRKEQ